MTSPPDEARTSIMLSASRFPGHKGYPLRLEAARSADGIVDFWHRSRLGEDLPHRGHFDADNLIPWLGNISVYESLDDGADFRNRLDGTNKVDLTGEDWTGLLASSIDGRHRTTLLQDLRSTHTARQPLIVRRPLLPRSYLFATCIFLPVATVDGTRRHVFLASFR